MLCHLLQYLVGNGCNIGAGLGAVDYVNRVAYAGSNDFSLNVVHLENLGDVVNQVNTRHGDVIQASKEWGYVGCACPCG